MSAIYIHIPYCHSKCGYCDFYSTPRTQDARLLVEAIIREYTLRQDEIASEISTIYIGGGTPSVLDEELLGMLAAALPQPTGEFTIEVNPEDVALHRVEAWQRMGINRVSMGVQSLVDTELQFIGRRHSALQALEAMLTIRKAGIHNLSLDLIYGLPGQNLESWKSSLQKVLDFHPEHLSAYILSYEPGTRLSALLRTGKITQADDALIEDMYGHLCENTRREGYEHYEISNFALPGLSARHNSGYWSGNPYLGLGPAAHSFDTTVRRINPSSIKDYLSALNSGRAAFIIDEENDDNRFNDLLITRLRTAQGLDIDTIEGSRLRQLLLDARKLIARGKLVLQGSRLFIPERHWLTSDSIITELIQIASEE